jgi:hypothetical protein
LDECPILKVTGGSNLQNGKVFEEEWGEALDITSGLILLSIFDLPILQ